MNPEELQLAIEQWKEEYGEVYQTVVMDEEKTFSHLFIFRALGREEYKDLLYDEMDRGEFQEVVCKSAVLYPVDYAFDEGKAGVADVLSSHILDIGGTQIGQPKALLNEFRAELMDYDYQADCLIHEAFPEYTLEAIQSWSVRKTMYFLSRAEYILINLRGVPIVPMEEEPQASEPIANHEFNFRKEEISSEEPQSEGELSEREVLNMLAQSEAQNGRNFSGEETNMNDQFPELSWFRHEEELRGEFD